MVLDAACFLGCVIVLYTRGATACAECLAEGNRSSADCTEAWPGKRACHNLSTEVWWLKSDGHAHLPGHAVQ